MNPTDRHSTSEGRAYPVEPCDPESISRMSAELSESLSRVIGGPVTLAEPLSFLDSSYGPNAAGFRLAGAALPEDWTGALQVRVAGRRVTESVLDREAAVLQFCAAQRYRTPAFRARIELGQGPQARPALVMAQPPGRGVVELISSAPESTGEVFGRLAERQVALHDLPLAGVGPLLGPAEAVDRIGRAGDDQEREWLRANAPASDYAPVLCHGGFHPLVVSSDDGGQLIVRNWTDPVRADPEYDVAKTLLVLWSAPFYTVTRTERAGLKMIRDMLANMYRGSYEKLRPLERPRVRYWQAYHALRAMGHSETPADLVPALAKHFHHLVAS